MKHVDINSLKHFLVTFALSFALGTFGAGVATGASITKEFCDNKYKLPWEKSDGHWCWLDLAFDAAGIITGVIANKLIF